VRFNRRCSHVDDVYMRHKFTRSDFGRDHTAARNSETFLR